MSFAPGTVFKPTEIGYQVKLNDLLSGNIPFRENVSDIAYFINCMQLYSVELNIFQAGKDRAYFCDGGNEIKIPAVAVTGLIKMNMDENMGAADKQFIKAVLIAIGPLDMIKSMQNIPKNTLAFLKGNSYKLHVFVHISNSF